MNKTEILAGNVYAGGHLKKMRRVESIEPHPGFATDVFFSQYEEDRWVACPRMNLNSFARWADRILPAHEHPAAETASAEEIHIYRGEMAHVFAVAMAREYDAKILAIFDRANPAWKNPENPDDIVPGAIHVYALKGEAVFDIAGFAGGRATADALITQFDIRDPAVLDLDEDGLKPYVKGALPARDSIEHLLPLASFTEEDIESARYVARRIFGRPLVRVNRR